MSPPSSPIGGRLHHLAAYEHLREVAFVEWLSRTTTGRVREFDLAGA